MVLILIKSMVKTDPKIKISGFTLTEIAIVLGITGLIMSAIWAATSSFYQNYLTQQASNEITTIINGVLKMGGWPNFSGATGPTLVDSGIIPPQFVTNNSSICGEVATAPPCVTNPWGGSIALGVAAGSHFSSVANGAGYIYMTGLNASQCTTVLFNVGNLLASNYGLILMGVSQDPQGTGTGLVSTQTIPATLPDAANVCTSLAQMGQNAAVGFVFNEQGN